MHILFAASPAARFDLSQGRLRNSGHFTVGEQQYLEIIRGEDVPAYSHSDRRVGGSGAWHGLTLAKSLGARISVMFVVEPFSELSGRLPEAISTYAELRKEQAASALHRAANAARETGVSCETLQVENAQPHQATIAAAESRGCDLIVMSSHGGSGLSMLLIGSVSNKVLTQPKTPVLVCP